MNTNLVLIALALLSFFKKKGSDSVKSETVLDASSISPRPKADSVLLDVNDVDVMPLENPTDLVSGDLIIPPSDLGDIIYPIDLLQGDFVNPDLDNPKGDVSPVLDEPRPMDENNFLQPVDDIDVVYPKDLLDFQYLDFVNLPKGVESVNYIK